MTAAVLFRGLIADDKEMICWNRNLISIFYVYLSCSYSTLNLFICIGAISTNVHVLSHVVKKLVYIYLNKRFGV